MKNGGFFSVPLNQLLDRLLCALTPPPPPTPTSTLRVYGTHPNICANVKDPISICRKKKVGITAGGMETRKHGIHENEKKNENEIK